jgi:hypothetical protein
MIKGEPNLGALKFIRQLTNDGVLTPDEVWELAEYLNNDKAARKSWPGEDLFKSLHSIFEDGVLEAHEIEVMHQQLRDVEHAWADHVEKLAIAGKPMNPRSSKKKSATKSKKKQKANPPPIIYPVNAIPIRLDPIKGKTRVTSESTGEVYDLSFRDYSCTCPDWCDRRMALPDLSPGKLCKHLTNELSGAILEHGKETAENSSRFKRIIHMQADVGRGFDPAPNWFQLEWQTGYCIASWGHCDWANIYFDDGADIERYGFSLIERRWSYGKPPKDSKSIEKFFEGL